MAQIGNFGSKITFETSDSKILNFSGFKKEVSSRWVDHEIVGKAPERQFLGPDNSKVTFNITLDARHGVRPRTTLKTIEKCVTNGTPYSLVIGGTKVGKYVMTQCSETWDEIMNKGELVRATCSVTLEEYS
ncbi:MAG: phage tail protein [Coprobacillus sp.]|nr:phage tail protein [Coprobacillus sp.]